MADHPNAERLRRGYEAFGKGDMETLRELIAQDVVWHAPGDNALSGDYKGLDETLQLFGRFHQETGGTMKFEIHDIIANDDHGVALTEFSAQRQGKQLSQRGVHVVHFNSDGKLTESWQFPEDSGKADDF